MKKVEKIIVPLFIVSGTLSYNRILFGSTLFTFFGLAMCVYYTLGGFLVFNNIRFTGMFKKSSYPGIGVKEILISILAGISMSYVIISFLFSLNRWGNYETKVTFFNGLMFSVLCILLSLIFHAIGKHPTYRRILWRLLPATILSVIAVWIVW